MSNKVKTPWYKRIYGFLEKHLGGTLTRFLLTIFGVYFLVFVIVIVIGVATKGEVGGGVDSTTTYSESSTIVPVYSLIDGKDAESLYYHTNDYTLLPFEKMFQSLLGVSDEDKEGNKGTLIFYNKSERTYTSKPIKGMKLSRKSSKGEAESYYARKYEGYQGAPKPVYSYSPTVELVAYKDGTYEWKSNDNWKLDNEAELQSYISSSPKKED